MMTMSSAIARSAMLSRLNENDCHCSLTRRCHIGVYAQLHGLVGAPFTLTDTIVYSPRSLPVWYFTHRTTGQIQRKHRRNVTPNNIIQTFLAAAFTAHAKAAAFSQPPCDIVATFTHSTVPNNALRIDEPSVIYLNEMTLRRLLHHLHERDDELSGQLQPFVVPFAPHNTVYRVLYEHPYVHAPLNVAPSESELTSPHSLARYTVVDGRMSMNALANRTFSLGERAVVYDTDCAQNSRSGSRPASSDLYDPPILTASMQVDISSALRSALEQSMRTVIVHHNRRRRTAEFIVRCEMYFKVDYRSALTLFYARQTAVLRFERNADGSERCRTLCCQCHHIVQPTYVPPPMRANDYRSSISLLNSFLSLIPSQSPIRRKLIDTIDSEENEHKEAAQATHKRLP